MIALVEERLGKVKELCEKYQVNGQTAWSLLRKAERFDVRIVTDLNESELKKMRLTKILGLDRLAPASGYIIPNGAKFAVK